MSIGRQDYQDRREERIDRLEERAAKTQAQSVAAVEQSRALVEHIPFGQPILVGHHSEKGHRRTLERSRSLMDKAVDLGAKAQHQEHRAEAARNNKAISGDDPQALQKLQAKIEAIETFQTKAKAVNAYYRKHKTLDGCPGLEDKERREIEDAWSRGWYVGTPYPPYTLSNMNAEKSRLKKRLAQLQAVDEMDHVEIPFDGGEIVTNEEINRVQILFDGKPDEQTRSKLKGYGFRWSPREGAWQTQRTPQNLRRACDLLGVTLPTKPAPEPKTDPDGDDWVDRIDGEWIRAELERRDRENDHAFVDAVLAAAEAAEPKPETPQELELAPGYVQTLLPLA
ncbi:MAG: DUF3560 domain-containing protein [Muribaculaceae bacterium]|nr:DUF3560 domain-containing protein [Muribaculaceae bacterium]MCM1439680.1 DUF3560 domain-containing protein [Roseburia sp.]